MKKFFRKLREFFERFYSAEPFTISFSKFKILLFLLLILAGTLFFYLRSQEKDGLEILKTQHHQIQLQVRRYLNRMSGIEINTDIGVILDQKINEYKKKLSILEEEINQKKKIWFLD